jgi:hypothetical protein
MSGPDIWARYQDNVYIRYLAGYFKSVGARAFSIADMVLSVCDHAIFQQTRCYMYL